MIWIYVYDWKHEIREMNTFSRVSKVRWNGCDWSFHLDNINGLENHVNKIIVIEWPCLTIHICLLKRPQWWSISLLFSCFAWYRSATTADSLYEEEHLGTPSPQWYLLSFWYKFPAIQKSIKIQCNKKGISIKKLSLVFFYYKKCEIFQ